MVRRILFLLDAETAHRFTVSVLHHLAGLHGGRAVLRALSGVRNVQLGAADGAPEIWGMRFRNRVGLAAGFDKGGELLAALPSLGFGFAELGTVTPRPQLGNERPRLFRNVGEETVFNRMGFNNPGAMEVAHRIKRARADLPNDFRIGINIGKNKDTPLDRASDDYLAAIIPFRNLVDYVVVNVSSPNTEGLRSLQTVEALRPILEKVEKEISSWSKRPPLLVKLAPETVDDALLTLLQKLPALGVDGWVLTNTLAGKLEGMTGGWSGRLLTQRSMTSLIEARRATSLPIISVGGIGSGPEALARLNAGADLIQIYSAWIFKGPELPARIAREISSFRL